MVVRQRATADADSGEAIDVLRMHPVVNCFSGPVRLRRGDGRFQIHDPQIDAGIFQFLNRVTPNVVEAHRPRDRAVRILGKADIFARVANVWFVQGRIHRVRQRLVDAAPCHHIAGEKQAQRLKLGVHFYRNLRLCLANQLNTFWSY